MRAAPGSAGGGPLDTYANNYSPAGQSVADLAANPAERRYLRRAGIAKLTEMKRLRQCGWCKTGSGLVAVRVRDGIAGYAGLQSCGSVWVCPVCNAKIVARKALEVGSLLAAAQAAGWWLAMETWTTRHRLGMKLAPMLLAQSYAWNQLRACKAYAGEAERTGLRGATRAAEITIGVNGWHPHLHPVLLGKGKISDLQLQDLHDARFGRWSAALVRRGYQAPLTVGQDIRRVRTAADIAEYVTKGTDKGLVVGPGGPAATQGGGAAADVAGLAGLGRELTHSQGKFARGVYGTRPAWELLDDILGQGDADALRLWDEYERATLGRRMLTYSRGIREELGVRMEDKTDEQIVAEEVGTRDDDIFYITDDGWAHVVARPVLIPRILAAVREGGLMGCQKLLDREHIGYVLTDKEISHG